MNTLIVEDVHFLSLILQRFLEPYGKCDTVSDGAVAIEMYSRALAKREPYDLICLDLLMPKVDGIEVLQTIRNFEKESKIEESKAVKIIIISTLNDEKTVSKARSLGCSRYITKPFSKKKLIKEVMNLGLIELDPPAEGGKRR